TGRRIERRERLVEEPERLRLDEQPGERETAALALGEQLRRVGGVRGETQPLERRVDSPTPLGGARCGAAAQRLESFRRGEFALNAVLVSDVGELGAVLVAEKANGRPAPADLARRWARETAKRPQ